MKDLRHTARWNQANRDVHPVESSPTMRTDMITVEHVQENEDGTHDVRLEGDFSGPALWQIEIGDGELGKVAWVDEETEEAISGIPDDEGILEALEQFAEDYDDTAS